LTSKKSHVAHSYRKSITWLDETLGSNCNCTTEVHNYMVFIVELQIKATAGSENYNYNYCIRKIVIIM